MLSMIFCSHLAGVNWLQNYLIPCPFKKLTGIDCPGCGFQRSMLALLQGDLGKSFSLYPATIPFLFALAFTLVEWRYRFDKNDKVKKVIYIFTGLVIMGSYIIKMSR